MGPNALETRGGLTHTVFTQMNIHRLGCAEGSRALGWKHRFSTDCKTEDHSGERRRRGNKRDMKKKERETDEGVGWGHKKVNEG